MHSEHVDKVLPIQISAIANDSVVSCSALLRRSLVIEVTARKWN